VTDGRVARGRSVVGRVAADAAQGAVNNVTVKADAAVGNAKFEATSAATALTVE